MNNYKIRVNNEAESLEARGLFCELGFSPDSSKYEKYVVWVAVFEDGSGSFYNSDTSLSECQELTFSQLRDLVVLHQNVVMDATHVGKSGSEYYVTDAEEVYFFDGMEWVLKDVNVSNLKPIQKPQLEQGLISGADALRALADGEDVQGTLDLKLWVNARGYGLDEFLDPNTSFKFRLKTRTVKLEIEVPAPFEPKYKEKYWFVNTCDEKGYSWGCFFDGDHRNKYGAWRKEAEIKIVVEQFRKLGVLK